MPRVRAAAVAGSFYPAQPQALRAAVRGYLRDAGPPGDVEAKALIVPHAGYVYSGAVAGSGYARIGASRARVERVVLLGPAHRVPVRGLAAPAADRFETPLGGVDVDREALERVLALPQVAVSEQAHALEHSLEVHLPFLQEVLGDFVLVPLVVGDATAREVADVLDLLWGGDETLVVVSTDLSHYHDYDTARRIDAETTRAIERLAPDAIGSEEACGCVPVRGLLLASRERKLAITTLDVRNSGDTAGPHDRVVGYGAYVVA